MKKEVKREQIKSKCVSSSDGSSLIYYFELKEVLYYKLFE